MEIALSIKTKNPRILEDFVDMALTIDHPSFSKRLIPHAISLAENKFAGFGCQKLGLLVIHWAQTGALPEALQLTSKIICLSPDPKRNEKAEELKNDPHSPFTRLDPVPLYDIHLYKKFLEENIR